MIDASQGAGPDRTGPADRFERLLGYLQQDPDNLHLLREAAECAMQQGRFSSAAELVDRALALDPSDNASRYRKAVILAHAGQANDALTLTHRLLDEGLQDDAILFQHACNLILCGQHADAEPILSELAPRARHFPGFAFFHIRALHAAGKLDEAIALAQAQGDEPVAQGMLSLIYVDDDKLEEGAALARQVLATQPDNVDALLASGSVSLAMEEAQAALPSFEQVARRQANNGRAWMGIGLAKLTTQDFPGAREALEKAVRYMPSHLGTWNALAWLQIMQGDFDAAQKSLDTVLAINRNFGESHGTLAVLMAARQDWEGAKRETDLALRLQPDSFAGRFAQSMLLEHRGRGQQAQQLVLGIMQNFKAPAGGTLVDVARRFVQRNPDLARRLGEHKQQQERQQHRQQQQAQPRKDKS